MMRGVPLQHEEVGSPRVSRLRGDLAGELVALLDGDERALRPGLGEGEREAAVAGADLELELRRRPRRSGSASRGSGRAPARRRPHPGRSWARFLIMLGFLRASASAERAGRRPRRPGRLRALRRPPQGRPPSGSSPPTSRLRSVVPRAPRRGPIARRVLLDRVRTSPARASSPRCAPRSPRSSASTRSDLRALRDAGIEPAGRHRARLPAARPRRRAWSRRPLLVLPDLQPRGGRRALPADRGRAARRGGADGGDGRLRRRSWSTGERAAAPAGARGRRDGEGYFFVCPARPARPPSRTAVSLTARGVARRERRLAGRAGRRWDATPRRSASCRPDPLRSRGSRWLRDGAGAPGLRRARDGSAPASWRSWAIGSRASRRSPPAERAGALAAQARSRGGARWRAGTATRPRSAAKLVPRIPRLERARLATAGIDLSRELFGALAPGARPRRCPSRRGSTSRRSTREPLGAIRCGSPSSSWSIPLADAARVSALSERIVRLRRPAARAARPGRSRRRAARWRGRSRAAGSWWPAARRGGWRRFARGCGRRQAATAPPPTSRGRRSRRGGLGALVLDTQNFAASVRALLAGGLRHRPDRLRHARRSSTASSIPRSGSTSPRSASSWRRGRSSSRSTSSRAPVRRP